MSDTALAIYLLGVLISMGLGAICIAIVFGLKEIAKEVSRLF